MSNVDLEQGHHRRSSSVSDTSVEDSIAFSDADEGSCYSMFYSMTGGSYDDYRFDYVSDREIGRVSSSRRGSSVSECSVDVGDGVGGEIKVHLANVERDCRICHLGLDSSDHESGIGIELGCSCKADLAAAHKNCAEHWFKIKGNKICEICNSLARNVVGSNEVETTIEQTNATTTTTAVAAATATSPPPTETQSFWQGHRFLNFMLACMVFAFVISWLFHFNVPS